MSLSGNISQRGERQNQATTPLMKPAGLGVESQPALKLSMNWLEFAILGLLKGKFEAEQIHSQ